MMPQWICWLVIAGEVTGCGLIVFALYWLLTWMIGGMQ
jgi:hypothetical protein